MSRRVYDDELLINILKEYSLQINRTPTYLEFEKDTSVPSATLYKKRFKKWNNALELAGLKLNARMKHSKEDITKEAYLFFKLNNRSPLYYELSYSIGIIRKYWNGWNSFLKDIGLPLNLNYSSITSRDELTIFLQNLCESLGKVPNTSDVEEAGVGRHLFLTKFGSFKNALITAKVVNEDYFKSIKEKVPASLTFIKEFYKQYKIPPSVKDYESMSKEKDIAERRALEQVFEMRYTEICFKAIGVANQFKRSKEQLLQDLKMLKIQLGRTPIANELVLNGLAEKKQYYRTFGMTYIKLVEELGWEISTPKIYYKTEDELLEDYNKLYNILGRLPFYIDIDNQNWMSSSSTYKKYFGDLTTIWEVLEIEVDEGILINNYGRGNTCLDKNNKICRSVPEMIITNILIDLGLKFSKEYPYKKCISNLKNKYRFDWYLLNYKIGIEYFGLFSEDGAEMDNFIGRYSRGVIRKIKLCDVNNVNLIDIYPEDLDNIGEVLMKRMSLNGINFEV